MLIMIIITELKESVELKREEKELPWYYNYISPVQSTVQFQRWAVSIKIPLERGNESSFNYHS